MKWKDIPKDFKKLIKQQYSYYRDYTSEEQPEAWGVWLKRQGHGK